MVTHFRLWGMDNPTNFTIESTEATLKRAISGQTAGSRRIHQERSTARLSTGRLERFELRRAIGSRPDREQPALEPDHWPPLVRQQLQSPIQQGTKTIVTVPAGFNQLPKGAFPDA